MNISHYAFIVIVRYHDKDSDDDDVILCQTVADLDFRLGVACLVRITENLFRLPFVAKLFPVLHESLPYGHYCAPPMCSSRQRDEELRAFSFF